MNKKKKKKKIMSDLGEEFAQICIQWLKKALVYAFWLHSGRVFPI